MFPKRPDYKTKTTPYHPESDRLVERFNRTLLLAMFAGEHKDDWDDFLPPVMMAYRSSVHESMGFSPYRLMFGDNAYGYWTTSPATGPRGGRHEPICCLGQGLVRGGI